MLGERSDQRGLWEADRLYLDHVGKDTFYGLLGLTGRVNDVRGGTGPLQGESDLLAGGLDLFIVEVAGCTV